MQTTICNAINSKTLLGFDYDGYNRVVEPRLLGFSKTNKYQLRCYQTGGLSESNKLGWKLFDLDKIKNINSLNETFPPYRLEYNPNDTAMQNIICRI